MGEPRWMTTVVSSLSLPVGRCGRDRALPARRPGGERGLTAFGAMVMTRGFGLLLAGILCASAAGAAWAQAGRKPQPASAEKVGSIYGGASVNGGDVDFEGELRLSFKGSTLTAAALDACTSTDPTSGVSDRFKATLSIKGNDLTGSGTTDIGRQPFTVSLKRSANGDGLDLTGQIGVGGVPIALKAEGVDLQPAENNPEDAPEPVAGAVPTFNALSIRTPHGRAREVLDVLRPEQASDDTIR